MRGHGEIVKIMLNQGANSDGLKQDVRDGKLSESVVAVINSLLNGKTPIIFTFKINEV